MKKIFLPLVTMILFLTGCGGGEHSDNANSMRHSRVIVNGIDAEFPPMAFHNEQGEIVGFDVELAKEAARRMGVEIEFKPIDWENKEAEITSGNIDMIWNGCSVIDEYKKYMIFSKPYMTIVRFLW